MKKIIALAATLTALCSLAACGGSGAVTEADSSQPASKASAVQAERIELSPDSPQLKQIKVEKVKMLVVPIGMVSAPSKVEANANRLSHVVLPVAGRIMAVNARIGDLVEQGQMLVTVESPEADAAISTYLQVQAASTSSKSAAAKAQSDLDREQDLFDHGAVPQKEVLNAKAVLVQAEAAVKQNEAAMEQARRRLKLLGLSADNFGQGILVSAPISGKVLDISVVKGEYRNDLSAPLMTIADLSSVWVSSDVPETSIRLLKVGEPMKIQLDAYPGEAMTGRVVQIGDTVDPQTRTVKVRAELPNPGGRLKPEMFGSVQFAESSESKPTAPAGAVGTSSSRSFVWRVVSPGVFERATVTTGAQIGDRIAILSGIEPSDSIVVDGVMLLQPK